MTDEAIKEYIATNYGTDGCVVDTTGNAFGAACMVDALAQPLPPGYTKEDICNQENTTWCYDNVGWCLTSPPPEEARIYITSTPSNARIYIDGTYMNDLTPSNADHVVPVGSHTIMLTLTDHQDWTQTKTLVANERWVISATLTPSGAPGVPIEVREYIAINYGVGECIVDTTGDAFSIACMTDNLAEPLPAGHTKETICTEEVTTWCFSSVGWCTGAPPEDEAYILVNSNPSGARIHIDNVYVGDLTPSNSEHVVTPGYHTVKLTLSGYANWEEGRAVIVNDTWEIEAALTPTEPVWQVEFVAGGVSGEIDVAGCTIPELVMLGREERFGIKVNNTGIPARFMVDLSFSGPTNYMASSEWVDVPSASSRTISVYFTAPLTAPLGMYTVTAYLYAEG